MVWELVALLAGVSRSAAAYLYRWVMAQPNDNPR